MYTDCRLLLLSALVLLAGAWNLSAYEPFQDGYGPSLLGDPIDKIPSKRSESSPAVPLRINLLQVNDSNLDGKSESSSTLASADLSRFTNLVTTAIGYWEKAPTTSIRMTIAGSDSTSTYVNFRDYILLTLGKTPSNVAGASWGRSYYGQYLPFGIIINIDYFRSVSDDVILSTIVHEIGHSIGMAHSSCDRYLTKNSAFGQTDSEGAFMSYGDKDGRAQLHTDDIAGIGALYAKSSAKGDFGSISGELVDSQGKGIFGGNVFAVNASNRAVASRISGLTGFTSTNSKHGKFQISGLAPGTYTLVGASVTDSTYRIGSVPSLPYDSYYTKNFDPAIMKNVVVKGGADQSVGSLKSGTTDEKPAFKNTKIVWRRMNGARKYYIHFFDYKDRKWIYKNKVARTNSMTFQMEEGHRYYLFVKTRYRRSWRKVTSQLVRADETPPLLTLPDSVKGTAGHAMAHDFGASDPLGGRIRIKLENAPAGVKASSGRLVWKNPVTGTYPIKVRAINEVGHSTVGQIVLDVEAPITHPVTVKFPAQNSDIMYSIHIYNWETKRWSKRRGLTENEAYLQLEAGQHTVIPYALRRLPKRRRGRTVYYRRWIRLGRQKETISGEHLMEFK